MRMGAIEVEGWPFELRREGPPGGGVFRRTLAGIELTAAPHSDLFSDPNGATQSKCARFVGAIDGDFILSAQVTPEHRAKFDAAVIVGYSDEDSWFKLCAERDPDGILRVVSVVTRGGASDDCNSWPIDESSVYLRVARLGGSFALHVSDDGVVWDLVRYFSFGRDAKSAFRFGIMAQSPMGEGVVAHFDSFHFEERTLSDIRDGT